MGVPFALLLALTIFKVETIPEKLFQINQHQTAEYGVVKDILIQNLIVTTDNLKLILNWERENTWYKIQDEEKSDTRLTNNNDFNDNKIAKNLAPFQYQTPSINDLQKEANDEVVKNRIKAEQDVPGTHTAKDVPVTLNSFELSKYLRKRSPNAVDKLTEDETKREIEREIEKEKYDKAKNLKRRETNEESSIFLSKETFPNDGNRDSFELDSNSDPKYNSEKTKRQAEGQNPLPIPTGDGDTQMFMGTFQAVMRPMKLPSLG